MKANNISRLVIYNLIALIYSWTIVFSITYSMNLQIPKLLVLRYCFVTILLLNLLFINRITVYLGIGLAIFAGLYYGYQLIELKLVQNMFSKINEFLIWIYDYIVGIQAINPSFKIYFVIMLTLIVAGMTFLLVVRHYNFYILLAVGLAYYLVTTILDFKMYEQGFSIYLFCMICLFGREVFNKRIRYLLPDNSRYQGHIYVLWAMPFAVLIILLASSISIEDDYKRPEWMDNGAAAFNDWYHEQSWFEVFDNWKGSDFSLASTGFQPDRNAVGGNIKLDDSLVMKIKADHRVYLKGSIRDYYTGKGWISTAVEEFSVDGNDIDDYITDNYFSNNRLFFDILRQTRYRRQSNQLYEQVFQHGNAQIQHINFRTNTLFYPDNMIELLQSNNGQEYLFLNSNAEFYFEGNAKSDNYYSLRYRMVDRSDPVVEELLRMSSPEIIQPSLNRSKNLKKKYEEIIAQYSNQDNITPKVSELAMEISKDYNNRYDKAAAIEKYLSTKYTYTLSPGDTPEGRDFAEYFLLDLKKGYCTYYASAMTLMVRSLGIPARYVEGYVLPANADSGGVYHVTNELSHAWVEVFLEGFGWVRFEPTSPFNALLNGQQDDNQQLSSGIMEDEEYEDYLRSLMGETDVNVDLSQDNQMLDSELGFLKGKTTGAIKIIMSAAGLLLLIIIVRRMIFKISISKAQQERPKKSIVAMYQKILKIMYYYDCGMKPGEAPMEYAQRIDKQFENADDSFYNITELYIKARYSNSIMQEQDKESLVKFYYSNVKNLKKHLNVFRFYYCKYIKMEF
ncbi:MAG: DUF4129 domain-containing transglutaminase family protein [Clostridia bacterium]